MEKANLNKSLTLLGITALLLFACVLSPTLGAVDDYQEKNPLVLYDDNEDFWSVGGYGSGNVGATLATSTATRESGASSLQINLNVGSYYYVEVGHDFHANNDWSMYETIGFWFYGSNSSNLIEVALAAPTSASQFMLTFNDNFTGWQHMVFPLNSFVSIGGASLSNVREIGFFFFDVPQTFYVDRLILDTSQTLPSPSPTPTTTVVPTSASTESSSTPTITPDSTSTSTLNPSQSPTNAPSSTTNTPTLAPSTTPYVPSPTPTQSPTATSSAVFPSGTILNLDDSGDSSGWFDWLSIAFVAALVVVVLVYVTRSSKNAKK